MIKLFSVKQKQKEAAESANGRAPVKKQSPGELRVQKGNFYMSLILALRMAGKFFCFSISLYACGT